MKYLTNGCENSTQDISKFISTNNLGHRNFGDLVVLKTLVSYFVSAIIPPPKMKAITR